MLSRGQHRRLTILAIALAAFLTWHIHSQRQGPIFKASRFPLLSKYLEGKKGSGGAWHIPQEWTHSLSRESSSHSENIIAAAELARNLTGADPRRQIPHSAIPRIIHQTWKDTNLETWPEVSRKCTEKWLAVAEKTPGEMAYFFWDDDGIAQFMRYFEPDLEGEFYALPTNVERSDLFRILVVKWIGGVYSDIDAEPIRTPATWITQEDIQPWEDLETGRVYASDQAAVVKAIVGIEADNPPDSDAYWRMGYAHPVQLTQWAFAFAADHPILHLFVERLLETLRIMNNTDGKNNKNTNDLRSSTPSLQGSQNVYDIDPVLLTGPAAFTESVRAWLEMKADLRWNAVSGLGDGGASKLVADVLVLPITGFSPGRGRYGNMGSKPVTDPSARLQHHAQGSWRKTSLVVEYGKFCRTVFGRCRGWSTVTHGHNWIY